MALATLLFDQPTLTGGGPDIKVNHIGHEYYILPNPVSLQILGTLIAA